MMLHLCKYNSKEVRRLPKFVFIAFLTLCVAGWLSYFVRLQPDTSPSPRRHPDYSRLQHFWKSEGKFQYCWQDTRWESSLQGDRRHEDSFNSAAQSSECTHWRIRPDHEATHLPSVVTVPQCSSSKTNTEDNLCSALKKQQGEEKNTGEIPTEKTERRRKIQLLTLPGLSLAISGIPSQAVLGFDVFDVYHLSSNSDSLVSSFTN